MFNQKSSDLIKSLSHFFLNLFYLFIYFIFKKYIYFLFIYFIFKKNHLFLFFIYLFYLLLILLLLLLLLLLFFNLFFWGGGGGGNWRRSCRSLSDWLWACWGNLGVCHYSDTLIGWCASLGSVDIVQSINRFDGLVGRYSLV